MAPSLGAFVSHVWEMGAAHARDTLPWRHTRDPYAIYVSEVMLQQTQVARVCNFWPSWMEAFPTIDSLAAAASSDVLERWQGLGYNRRGLALKRSADICASQFAGVLPSTIDELLTLPGVGPTTAAGVMAFAHNSPCVYLETNIRAVFIHHFFSDTPRKVADKEIIPLVEATCSVDEPRKWYYALLDYGAYLKASVVNPTRRAKAYSRQSRFEGSVRQKRAFLLREVLANPGIGEGELHTLLNKQEVQQGREKVTDDTFAKLLRQLVQEGFFENDHGLLIP